MVTDPGETLHTGAGKPVNLPEPVNIEEDSAGFPVAILAKRKQVIAAIEDRWRLDDEWWRSEPLARLYFSVRLATGNRLVLYKDLNDNRWYRQAY